MALAEKESIPLIRGNPRKYLNDRVFEVLNTHQEEFGRILEVRDTPSEANHYETLADTIMPRIDSNGLPKKIRPWKRTYVLRTRFSIYPEKMFANDFFLPLNKSIDDERYYSGISCKVGFLPWIITWSTCMFRFVFFDHRFSQYWWPFIAFYIALLILGLKLIGWWSLFFNWMTS